MPFAIWFSTAKRMEARERTAEMSAANRIKSDINAGATGAVRGQSARSRRMESLAAQRRPRCLRERGQNRHRAARGGLIAGFPVTPNLYSPRFPAQAGAALSILSAWSFAMTNTALK
jgi:hypothetical protein